MTNNRVTIYALKRAAEACGTADKLAKAADTMRGLGVPFDDAQVKHKLEVMTHEEARIAEIAKQLVDLDLFYAGIETSQFRDILQRIRPCK